MTGVLFQCMLRDPLAEPYTLGVSSGASVGAVLGICFGLRAIGLVSLAGAAAVLLIVLAVAVEGRRLSSFTLMLTGVTMNSMAFAIIMFLHNLARFSQSFAISRWLMGGLDAVEYSTLAWLAAMRRPRLHRRHLRAPVESAGRRRRLGGFPRRFDQRASRRSATSRARFSLGL